MKKLVIVACLLFASLAFATDRGDTIYNRRGQGIQAEAPNYFETLTVYSTWINLDTSPGTLYWSLYVPTVTTCKVRLTVTESTVGSTQFSIPAGVRVGYAKGYGIHFVNFSGCTNGEYKAMKGDWSQQ